MREHWSNRLGFILAALGSAVGLGTLWKFPYVTGQNGGGLFMLFYFCFTLFFAIPLFIGELVIGRSSQRASVGAFAALSGEKTPWKSVGWLAVLSSFFILSYYCVVAGWGLNYLMMSLNLFFDYHTPEEIPHLFDILSGSGDISMFWATMFLLLTFAVVYKGIRKGIERWSRILMILLVAFLLALTLYSITLDGFVPSLHFLFSPEAGAFKASSILEALGLSFFTLSLAQGVIITYGSYLNHKENVLSTAFIIGFFIIGISLLSVLMIFPVIFTFNLPIQGGPGLVFKTLPLLLAKLPGAMLLSTLFFALFTFAALTSSVALVEVIVANLMDLYRLTRKRAIIYSLIAIFIVIIPSALANSHTLFKQWEPIFGMTFFDSLDQLVSTWMLPIGGFLTALYLGWKLDRTLLREEFTSNLKAKWIFHIWFVILRWVVPIGVIGIFLQNSGFIDLDKMFVK